MSLFEHVGSLYYPLRLRPRTKSVLHSTHPRAPAVSGLGPGYLVYSCTAADGATGSRQPEWGEVVR